ncbi:uncharacterized protein N0V96_011338 [Colletotrichum fioriniae]|uniref:uncharacterized protein n=1 Tax=Colletotrichum fioriniae TaxID=710243 RepID=UPI0032DB6E35|nr:hypothetical protein N0V96_011338 [Colletotrichum fioriniae]
MTSKRSYEASEGNDGAQQPASKRNKNNKARDHQNAHIDPTTQANGIPHLLVAPKVPIGPQLPKELQDDDENVDDAYEEEEGDRDIYTTGEGDFRGYYADGAYTARPDNWGKPHTTGHDDEVEEGEWPGNEGIDDAEDQYSDAGAESESAIRAAYFAAILTRFKRLRKLLHSAPPLRRRGPYTPDPPRLPRRRLRAEIGNLHSLVQPPPRCGPSPGTTRLHGQRRRPARAPRLAGWRRVPPARERDEGAHEPVAVGASRAVTGAGEMNHVEVGSDDEEALREMEVDERDGDGETSGAETAGGKVGVQLQEDVAIPKDSAGDGEVKDGEIDDGDDQKSEPMDVSEDGEIDEGEVVEEEPAPAETLEEARARLLAQIDTAAAVEDAPSEAPSEEPIAEEAVQNEDDCEVSDQLRARMNMRATLNMILTVAGEFYGQRDLLEFRDPFTGM